MRHVIRTERGWAGHFCGAYSCRFRRNTLLECDNVRVIVSTVGVYVVQQRVETVGRDRYYETMAFIGQESDGYIDADISKRVMFASPWTIDHLSPTSDQEANDMHEAVVRELTNKLENNDRLVFEGEDC